MDYIVKIIPPAIEASSITQWISLLSVVVVFISLIYNNKKLDERQKEVSKFQQQQQQQAFQEQQAQQERMFKEQQAQQERMFKEQQAQQERLLAKEKAEFIAKLRQEWVSNFRETIKEYLTQNNNLIKTITRNLLEQAPFFRGENHHSLEKITHVTAKLSEINNEVFKLVTQAELYLDPRKELDKDLILKMTTCTILIYKMGMEDGPINLNSSDEEILAQIDEYHENSEIFSKVDEIKKLTQEILQIELNNIKNMHNNY